MLRRKISKLNVDRLEPRAKPYTMYDSSIAGFGAEVRPSGLIVLSCYIGHRQEDAERHSGDWCSDTMVR